VIAGLVESALLLASERAVVGRRVAFDDAVMTVAEVDCTLGLLGMALGQFDDVRVVVENVEWRGHTARRLAVTCRDVHVNPGPTLVAGPVDVELTLGSADIPRLDVGSDRLVRWGLLPLRPSVEDGELWVRTGLLPLRRRIPVPPLPNGLRLTGVRTGPGEVVLTARAPQWRERVSLGRLVELLRSA
jgi:hypothetical protein